MELVQPVQCFHRAACPFFGHLSGSGFKRPAQDRARLLRRALRNLHLQESPQKVRITAPDHAHLLGRAFRDGQNLSSGNPRAQETTDALLTALRLAHFKQLTEIPEVQDGIAFHGFAAQLLTALLPHPKTNRARHEAGAIGGPKRRMAESELVAPSRQFPHQGCFPAPGGADQQKAAAMRACESLRQLSQLNLHLKSYRQAPPPPFSPRSLYAPNLPL